MFRMFLTTYDVCDIFVQQNSLEPQVTSETRLGSFTTSRVLDWIVLSLACHCRNQTLVLYYIPCVWSNCVYFGALSICCIYCDCQFWVRIFIAFGVGVACNCLSSILLWGASCPAAINSHRMFVNTYTHAYIWSTHPHNIQSCRHVNTDQPAIVPTRIPASHINTSTQRRGKSETEIENGIELFTKILDYCLWNN